MKQINARTLCAISISFILTTALSQKVWPNDVSYEDLENLGASCAPRDTCANVTYEVDGSTDGDNDSSFDKYCDCGINCIKYDNCCVDSPYRRYNTRFYRAKTQACVYVYGQPASFFVVSECDPRWEAPPHIQNNCNKNDIRDPYSLVPAFDHKNNVTYKNFFCALCNGVKPESFTLWTITMETTGFQNYSNEELVEDMTFNEERESWGRWEKIGDEWNFKFISITINAPRGQYLKRCIRNLIQSCDPTWTDRTISQKCLSYMAPIYGYRNNSTFFSKTYRNVHCAICNNALLRPNDVCYSESSGGFGGGFGGGGSGGVIPISFTLLFDVNPRDGVQVGKISKCKAGESYDPFFKKCRSLVCGIPGYVLEKNRCVRS